MSSATAANPFDDPHHFTITDDDDDETVNNAPTLQQEQNPFSDPPAATKPNWGQAEPIPLPTIFANSQSTHPPRTKQLSPDELERRESALAERERRLQEQEEAFRLQSSGGKPPNFPWFYPWIYHDIDVEIKREDRKLVRGAFYYWLGVMVTLVFNVICALLLLTSHTPGITTAGSDLGVSFVYVFTITLASFFLWYRPLYNAYMKEKSIYYFFFFIFNAFHLLFALYMAIGIPGAGSVGLINTISLLSAGKVLAGVFGLVDSILWLGQVGLGVFLYKQVHAHYLRQGHTFEQAKGQAITIGAMLS